MVKIFFFFWDNLNKVLLFYIFRESEFELWMGFKYSNRDSGFVLGYIG